MKHALLLLSALSSALLTGCKDETLSGYADPSVVWALTELDGKPFDAKATMTLKAGGGMISGQGPCNVFGATQDAPYPWFEAKLITSTKRACAALPAEQAFFAALTEMEISEVSGSVLILSNEAGRRMVFEAHED